MEEWIKNGKMGAFRKISDQKMKHKRAPKQAHYLTTQQLHLLYSSYLSGVPEDVMAAIFGFFNCSILDIDIKQYL
jgi:hypothetical protein